MNTPSPLNHQPNTSGELSSPNPPSSLWTSFWHSTVSYLLKGSEPQVNEKQDRTGKIWFYIYDPVTGRTHRVGSESEAIAWMERNRY